MPLRARRTTRLATTATLIAALLTTTAHAGPAAAAEPDHLPATVDLTSPATSLVRVGQGLAVTGTVAGAVAGVGEDRRVRLHLRTPNGLLPMGPAVTTADDGSFRLPVPTWWAWRGTLVTTVERREAVLPLGLLGALVGVVLDAVTTALASPVEVTLGWSGAGSPTAWRPLLRGFRYDPCSPLTYRVNPTGAPAGGVRAVHGTFRRIAEASGLRFRYAGRTTAIPFNDVRRARYAPRTSLTIAWATPRQVRRLAGGVVGIGGSGGRMTSDGSVGVFDRGGVVLDRTFRAPARFGPGQTLGTLLLHEVGHAVGLGHVGDARQVMYPSLRPDALGRWGAGDLAGLRRVGAGQGCASLTAATRVAGRTVAGGAPEVVRFAPDPHAYALGGTDAAAGAHPHG
ncbi:matrixin family metalloprotease [Nocardioides perillae]|uniref:Peptidase M10 metallopeptidase domain-containing protein n=1 Tax=Nocardioides perillae TaxID=1119534 RepID=A0A7Y9UKU4_9ACTN|nr:matrixin family metalloprotease [Nocardioides perillae]NYG54327.1 hypothetical protein [Nocardioides perillae]